MDKIILIIAVQRGRVPNSLGSSSKNTINERQNIHNSTNENNISNTFENNTNHSNTTNNALGNTHFGKI
jgi:hypothetical protein